MAIDLSAKIYVAGHSGLVGSAIVRRLSAGGFDEVVAVRREEVDLRDQSAVDVWFDRNRPQYVILAAGTVGGIHANASRPAEFLYDNMMIHATVVHAAYRHGVEKLLYLGSSCIYPRQCPQPIREDYLLTGPLEPTNEAYAVAKIAGIRLCQSYRRQYGCNFVSAMPTNLYGPHDNFDLESSHVLPALLRRFHEAKTSGSNAVTIWGTGSARREFLHVDDLADACLFLLENYDDESPINVGTGEDLAIGDLARQIRDLVAPEVDIAFDRGRPDGTPRKLLDVTRLHELGWRHRISLAAGLRDTYEWFAKNYDTAILPRAERPVQVPLSA
jgi:GDP-L-fucose synthase